MTILVPRPWHDAWAIVLLPAQSRKKEAWAGNEKPALR